MYIITVVFVCDILFLSQESETKRIMKRQDRAHGITEIQHDEGKQLWLVVKATLDEASQVPMPLS